MPTQAAEIQNERVTHTLEEIRAWIVQEIARGLKVPATDIDVTAPLTTLGVDSVEAFGLTGALAEWLNRDLPATLMWDYPSIQAIAEGLADRPTAGSTSWPGVVHLQPLGERTPLFFFPGQRGHPVTFTPLASAMAADQPCFGLTMPGLEGNETPLEEVEEIASAMLKNLRLVQPHGPYQLAGYSFGGLLAYEAARQLTAEGETVSTVAIYDTFNIAGKRLRPVWQRAGLYLYLLGTQYLRLAYVRERLERRRCRRAEKRTRYCQSDGTPVDPATILRAAAVETASLRAVDRYRPKLYDGSVVFFRATQRGRRNIFYSMDATGGWGDLAKGGVRVVDLPGNHFNMLSAEHAATAAEKLAAVLK